MTITKLDNNLPQLPDRLNAAAYARVSSGKDAMLHSLAAQVSYYAKLIQSRGEWIYKGVYADEACTGTKDNRAEFKRLLADCRAGLIDLVITKSISRFARNTVDLLVTIRELKALGIDVYFEEQNIHTQSSTGEVLLTLLAGFAQEESHSVSENCKWRIRKRYEQGENVNLRFLYGYNICKGELSVNEEQAAIVRQIFEDYIGGLGNSLIARKLNAAGIPNCNGGKWYSNAIGAIIRNEKYAGNSLLQKYYVSDHLTKLKKVNKGELPKYYAENTHPAIVSVETYEQAQLVRLERTVTQGAEKVMYPFTSKIVCGCCGRHYKRKKGLGRFYWQCSTFLQEGKAACPAKQIPESVLIEQTDGLEFEQILVTGENTFAVTLSDGKILSREWQFTSRRESWTEEMREAARQRNLERSGTNNG